MVGKEAHCLPGPGWPLARLSSVFHLPEMGAVGGVSVRLIAGN